MKRLRLMEDADSIIKMQRTANTVQTASKISRSRGFYKQHSYSFYYPPITVNAATNTPPQT